MSSNVNAIDVTYQTEVNLENKSTEQLAAEVNVRYHQAEGLANMSAMMLADAGRRLIEIKGRIPHGQFESWCADNLEFSKSKAEKMMKLAERVDDESSLFSKTETFTDIGISRVWALLAAPEEVAAEVIETHDVSDMTVRELKEEIARLKEEKAAAELGHYGAEIIPVEDTNAAVDGADLIILVTVSGTPVCSAEHFKPGAVISAVGAYTYDMQELDPAVFDMCGKIYFDSETAVLSESGDILRPLDEGTLSKDQFTGDIGDYILGKIPGRESDDEIIVFENVGIGALDLYTAQKVYDKATEAGIGLTW